MTEKLDQNGEKNSAGKKQNSSTILKGNIADAFLYAPRASTGAILRASASRTRSSRWKAECSPGPRDSSSPSGQSECGTRRWLFPDTTARRTRRKRQPARFDCRIWPWLNAECRCGWRLCAGTSVWAELAGAVSVVSLNCRWNGRRCFQSPWMSPCAVVRFDGGMRWHVGSCSGTGWSLQTTLLKKEKKSTN